MCPESGKEEVLKELAKMRHWDCFWIHEQKCFFFWHKKCKLMVGRFHELLDCEILNKG